MTLSDQVFGTYEDEIGVSDPMNPSHEIVEARLTNSRSYNRGGDKRSVLVGLGVIQFKNESNEWEDSDLSMDADIDEGDNGWRLRNASYRLFVPNNAIAFRYTSRRTGHKLRYRLNRWNGQALNTVSPNITPEVISTEEYSGFIWRDVKPGLDIILQITANGVEFFKVLKTEAAADSLSWRITHDEGSEVGIQLRARGVDSNPNRPLTYRIDNTHNISTDAGVVTINRTETFLKQVKRRHPVTRVPIWKDTVTYPVKIDTQIIEDTAAASDDGFGKADPPDSVSPSDTWNTAPFRMQYYRGGYGTYAHAGAARWLTVPLPTGQTLNTAYVTLQIFTVVGGGQAVTWYGDDVDSCAAWTAGNNPWHRTRTSASATHTYSATGSIKVDVSSVVKEIYARTGWASNNNMGLFAIPTGFTGSGNTKSDARVYQFGSVMPRLEINYNVGPTIPTVYHHRTRNMS